MELYRQTIQAIADLFTQNDSQYDGGLRWSKFLVYLYRTSAMVIHAVGWSLIFIILVILPLGNYIIDLPNLPYDFVKWQIATVLLCIAIMTTTLRSYTRYRMLNVIFFICLGLEYFFAGYLLSPITEPNETIVYLIYLAPLLTVVTPTPLSKRVLITLGTMPLWFIGVYLRIGGNTFMYFYSIIIMSEFAAISIMIGHLCYYRILRDNFFQSRRLEEQKKKIDKMAKYDNLTGLLRRDRFDTKLEEQLTRSKRYNENLAIAMFDLDHFKHVNDTYGHDAGDDVLERFGDIIQEIGSQKVRQSDITARYGGEEFIVALPNTKITGAAEMANRVRKEIMDITFKSQDGQEFELTVSAGCAEFQPGDSIENITKRADEALYDAKQKRNCVVWYKDDNIKKAGNTSQGE